MQQCSEKKTKKLIKQDSSWVSVAKIHYMRAVQTI